MLTFKRTTLTLNGEATRGYRVEGLDTSIFRGLQVVVVKNADRWHAHEATTGKSLTPPSWAGGLSNKTRAGIIQIVSHQLRTSPESCWERIQAQLGYNLQTHS